MLASHCPTCGATYPSALHLDEEGARTCPSCGAIHYVQLKVGAATIVEQDDQILLLRRSEEPFKWFWGLPAGFVRWNESPESAAIREAQEEAGVRVELEGLLGVYFFDDDPRGNGVLIVYRGRLASGSPRASAEASAAMFFARDSMPTPLAGSGQDQAIAAWAGL